MQFQAWTIQLKAETSLLIGSHRLDNNRYTSLDYIPYHVLQAAMARAILETHEQYSLEKHGKEKPYYIDPSDSEITADGCHPQWREWFRAFDQLYLNDGRPMGRAYFPPTTFACKQSADHPLRETLPERYLLRHQRRPLTQFFCATCGGRLERKSGWHFYPNETLYYRQITRVGLDERRLVSRDEHLYTLSVLEPYSFINPDTKITKPLYFYSTVYAPQGVDLSLDNTIIHVGAYLTTGLGRMRIRVFRANTEQHRHDAMKRWEHWQQLTGDTSVAIQLLTDAELPVSFASKSKYRTQAEWLTFYTDLFHHCSNLPEGITVEAAFLNVFQRRHVQYQSQIRRAETLTTLLQQGSVFILNGPKAALNQWVDEALRQGMAWNADHFRRRLSVNILSGQMEPPLGGGNIDE